MRLTCFSSLISTVKAKALSFVCLPQKEGEYVVIYRRGLLAAANRNHLMQTLLAAAIKRGLHFL